MVLAYPAALSLALLVRNDSSEWVLFTPAQNRIEGVWVGLVRGGWLEQGHLPTKHFVDFFHLGAFLLPPAPNPSPLCLRFTGKDKISLLK